MPTRLNHRNKSCLLLSFMAACFFIVNSLSAAELDLVSLSIEELMDIKVTSVGKKSQNLSDSPAAVYVITADDLKRSGVTSIPDALRMVPGMNVARIDSNKWAVSSRGFNSRFASKLLVLIDGRSVYTPTFSGVFWEVSDVLIEDIDRIEVVRGPGATLWGANAVNGVINIITRHAQDTHGGLVSAGGGNFEKKFVIARYGDSLGKDHHWRIFVKHLDRDEFEYTNGTGAGDDWEITRAGFRMDSELTLNDSLTVQGDIYHGNLYQELFLVSPDFPSPCMDTFAFKTSVSGGNLLARWKHLFSSTSDFVFQAYYDTTSRTEEIIDEERDSIDLDFQHRFAPGLNHDIVWGMRYRYTGDDYTDSHITSIAPARRYDDLYSFFIQDDITLIENRLSLILGSKFEHNDYTGFETQPSARLMWTVNPENKFWAAVSRAVRTPSRAESDITFSQLAGPSPIPGVPGLLKAAGSDDFVSEELMAYEMGYRFIPSEKVSLDISLFYNDYNDLRGFGDWRIEFTGTAIETTIPFINNLEGHTFGSELAVGFKPFDSFRCHLAYSFLHADIGEEESLAGGFPRHQASVRGQWNIAPNLEMDIWFRYVDDYSVIHMLESDSYYEIDDYLTMDLRLGWQITPNLELSLAGRNLLGSSRVEFVQEAFSPPIETDRSFYGKLTYTF